MLNKVIKHKILLMVVIIIFVATACFITYSNAPTSIAKINANFRDSLKYQRQTIDTIDKQILQLLNERASAAQKIAAIKKEHNLPIYVPKREEEVINNLQKQNHGPLTDAAISKIFTLVMKEMRELESSINSL